MSGGCVGCQFAEVRWGRIDFVVGEARGGFGEPWHTSWRARTGRRGRARSRRRAWTVSQARVMGRPAGRTHDLHGLRLTLPVPASKSVAAAAFGLAIFGTPDRARAPGCAVGMTAPPM